LTIPADWDVTFILKDFRIYSSRTTPLPNGPELQLDCGGSKTSTSIGIRFDNLGSWRPVIRASGVIIVVNTAIRDSDSNKHLNKYDYNFFHSPSSTLTDQCNNKPVNYGIDNNYVTTARKFDENCLLGIHQIFIDGVQNSTFFNDFSTNPIQRTYYLNRAGGNHATYGVTISCLLEYYTSSDC